VIFDFGGVISYPQRPRFMAEAAAMAGVEPAAFGEAYRRYRGEYDRGALDGPAYWRSVLNGAGSRDPEAAIDELIAFDTLSWTAINEGVLDAVRDVGGRGYRLAVLSNMPWDIDRYIRREFAWLGMFEEVTFSCEVGAIKPEPAIYAHALRRLGLAAGECLFVDDTEGNVDGALRFGGLADLETALAF
jgi:putative hydrolase of the HAD superfamily